MINSNFSQVDQGIASRLQAAFQADKLAHSYLFVSPDSQVAMATALWTACLVNCETHGPDGTCNKCQRILAMDYPDVSVISPESTTISIDQVRALKEQLGITALESDRRVYIINDAQKLTLNAANALLNLLEEPLAPVLTILTTNNEEQILPTIRSRTQILQFTAHVQNDLLDYGFSKEQVDKLGDTTKLKQQIKYLYEEMLEHNQLALVTAHQITNNLTNEAQKFIIYYLKKLATDHVNTSDNLADNGALLMALMQVDQMLISNVSFRNCIDWLVLNWKK